MATPSPTRIRTWQRLRRYEKKRESWDRDAGRGIAASGLLRRVEAGHRIRPYDLTALRRLPHRSAAMPLVAGWVAACWVLRRRVLVGSHATIAALCGVSQRTAGSAMREAVEAGWVEVRHHFTRARVGARVRWTERCASYRPSPRLRRLLKVGSGCQPTDHSASGARIRKGSPVGDGSIGAGCAGQKESPPRGGDGDPGLPGADCIGHANVTARFAALARAVEVAERLGPPRAADPVVLSTLCPGYGVRGHAGCALCAPGAELVEVER